MLYFKEMFIQQMRAKGINYEIDIDANVPEYIVLDEIRLKQILINLISNALKFTEKGSVIVHCNFDRKSKQI